MRPATCPFQGTGGPDLLDGFGARHYNFGFIFAFGIFFQIQTHDQEATLGCLDDVTKRRSFGDGWGREHFWIGGQLFHHKAILFTVGVLTRVE